MITKEYIKTREDGVKLYRTFSDTDHQIRKTKDGAIYDEAIDVTEDEQYEEVEDYVAMDGPETYDEVLASISENEKVARKINRIGLTDNEALAVKTLYPKWESKIGTTIEVGYVTLHNDNLWRARQTHTALEAYPPSMDTASLYEVINEEHSGTIDDPIPYTPPMEIFEGKYYTESDVLYLCTRDSGTALTHNLSALVGIYVELVTE